MSSPQDNQELSKSDQETQENELSVEEREELRKLLQKAEEIRQCPACRIVGFGKVESGAVAEFQYSLEIVPCEKHMSMAEKEILDWQSLPEPVIDNEIVEAKFGAFTLPYSKNKIDWIKVFKKIDSDKKNSIPWQKTVEDLQKELKAGWVAKLEGWYQKIVDSKTVEEFQKAFGAPYQDEEISKFFSERNA